jgi:FKBP-type peptidyl-prolyl cis-trans isomerase FkpA
MWPNGRLYCFIEGENMIRRISLLVTMALLLTGVPAFSAEPVLETDDHKTLYALGLAISSRLGSLELTVAEVELIKAGLGDGILGNEPQVDLEVFGPKIDPMLTVRAEAIAVKEKAAGAIFVEEAAKVEGAVKTASGAIYLEIEAGTGAQPSPTDLVKLHYHGTLRDGNVFDSSRVAGTPVEFRLDQVVPCFSDGIQKMKVGGKSKLTCPAEAAYGDRGAPPLISPGAALAFEVELLEILAAPTAADAVTPPAGQTP